MWGQIDRLAGRLARDPTPEDARARCSLYLDARLRRFATPAARRAHVAQLAERLGATLAARDSRYSDAPQRAAAAMLAAPQLRKLGHVGRSYVAHVNACASAAEAAFLTETYLASKDSRPHAGGHAMPRDAAHAERLTVALQTPRCHLARHGEAAEQALRKLLDPVRIRQELTRYDSEVLEWLAERAHG